MPAAAAALLVACHQVVGQLLEVVADAVVVAARDTVFGDGALGGGAGVGHGLVVLDVGLPGGHLAGLGP